MGRARGPILASTSISVLQYGSIISRHPSCRAGSPHVILMCWLKQVYR